MTIYERAFLQLLADAIGTGDHSELPSLNEEDWRSIFKLAVQHHVLPLIVDEVYQRNPPSLPNVFQIYRKRAAKIVSIQAAKTAAFLDLYRHLRERGLEPLVMKGIVCRQLYPNPDFRFSADEDLLIPPDEALTYHEALTAYGLTAGHTEDELTELFETPYVSEDRLLNLEIHRTPFPPESVAYGEFNDLFPETNGNAVTLNIENVPLRTLAPADHLLYLICHALKHFLHGGFGIRQVSDICLFAKVNGQEIDWKELAARLKVIRGETFAAALFSIGTRYLDIALPWQKEEQPLPVDEAEPDELLRDILDSGIYGASTMSRKHSSGITLGAVEKGRETENGRHSRRRLLFPPARDLRERFPYLKKHPVLLPVAWFQRIFKYFRSRNKKNNSAKEALRIGRERKELLRKYGLVRTYVKHQRPSETGKAGSEKKIVDTGAYVSSMVELIRAGNEVSLPVVGGSMTPFLGDGRDRVFLQKPEGRLKKGDVVLYQRLSGDYVLHRICRVRRNASTKLYDIVGDAQTQIERGIKKEQILGKVVRIERKGTLKTPGSFYWWFFQYIWVNIIPMRPKILRVYASIRRTQN